MAKKKKSEVIHKHSFICSCGSEFSNEKDMKCHKKSYKHKLKLKQILTIHFN